VTNALDAAIKKINEQNRIMQLSIYSRRFDSIGKSVSLSFENEKMICNRWK